MNLKEHLTEKKTDILKKWFDAVVETYPSETTALLKKQEAQFTNPVGHTLSEGVEHLFDALLQGLQPDMVSRYLDSIVRIRAVQDFAPSDALSFIFLLKKVIRKELGTEILSQQGIVEELADFESAIDGLALYAFDLYMKCREKIYDIKANEARRATFRLLQQARIIVKDQE